MKKKGVSPVIATVLLVGIVMALSVIVFFWFKSFVHESNLKFGADVSLSCPHVKFSAQYSDNTIQISNTGNVPIYDFEMRINQQSGSYTTKDISTVSSTWPQKLGGLTEGNAFSVGFTQTGIKSLTFIPILRGALKNGQQQSYPCDAAKYGQTVPVA